MSRRDRSMSRNGVNHASSADKAKRRASALFVVILLVASLIPMIVAIGPVSAEDGGSQKHTVVYEVNGPTDWTHGKTNNNSAENVEVTYYGSIVSTEYNPQMWFPGTVENGGSTTLPTGTGKWYDITSYVKGQTLVFTGWQYAIGKNETTGEIIWPDETGGTFYPGEVMSQQQMANATGNDGKIHIRATWGVINEIHRIRSDNIEQGSENNFMSFKDGNIYTNFVLLDDKTYLENEGWGNTNDEGVWLDKTPATIGFTIRNGTQNENGTPIQNSEKLKIFCRGDITCDVIIDNTKIVGNSNKHADKCETASSLKGNGHVLIIGSGVTTVKWKTDSANSWDLYPTLVGGSAGTNNTTIGREIYTGAKSETTPLGSFVIIHSGVYNNLVAGSPNVTQSNSAYMVVRDAVVLDSLIGGGGKTGTIEKDVYLYLTGLIMPGDSYEENVIYGEKSNILDTLSITLCESSILTGGSNDGDVNGSTNVYISGSSSVWDAQASGRRGDSYVANANLEVSGNATIVHSLSGSITDGKTHDDGRSCVKNISLSIIDAARVANVYGGGYDTYDYATYASMSAEGRISVKVGGSAIVGNVYGGGYRGDIGTYENPIYSISIDITGGTILGDVFGGGRGGVDKVLHNPAGTLNTHGGITGSNAKDDTTGKSRVYVKTIAINIAGNAKVNGNVYGGGESVAKIAGDKKVCTDVASVDADTISISVTENATVGESVYGAGKGIDKSKLGPVTPKIDVIKNGIIEKIDWYKTDNSGQNGFSSNYDNSEGKYSGYAYVKATSVSIDVSGSTVKNVYGGGGFSKLKTESDISISIGSDGKKTTITECVYGGGMGSENDSEAGRVDSSGSIRLKIIGKTTIGNLSDPYALYGGGELSKTEARGITIVLEKDVTINGDVYGGGKGVSDRVSTHANRTIVLNGAWINGNIYGGSSYGDDNRLDVNDNQVVDRNCRILLITGIVMQGVYGGGFNGKSYINSTIIAGTEAATSAKTDKLIDKYHTYSITGPSSTTVFSEGLMLNYIYGGGNLDSKKIQENNANLEVLFETPLLMGASDIRISASSDGDFPGYASLSSEDGIGKLRTKFGIYGDIYGSGNFSATKGSSSLAITGYDQYENTYIKSIQRFTEVTISGSHIRISGSSNASSINATMLLSLNDIVTLNLNGNTTLELSAETYKLSWYHSRTSSSTYATKDDYKSADDFANKIVLIGGVYFTALGPNNKGFEGETTSGNIPDSQKTGCIYGYTLIERPSDEKYHGAFAISTDLTRDDSGFVIVSGKKIIEANSVLGDPTESPTKTWYIAGYQTVTGRITYSGETTGWKASGSITLPRTIKGSVYWYVGCYTEPNVQNGFYLIAEGTDIPSDMEKPNSQFIYAGLKSGGSDTITPILTHTIENEQINPVTDNKAAKIGNSSNISFDTGILLPKSSMPSASGSIGHIIVHVAEYESDSSNIPINMINLVVELDVKPVISGDSVTIRVPVGNSSPVSNEKHGKGFINLTSEQTKLLRYSFVSVEPKSGEITTLKIWSDTYRSGSNGWVSRLYSEDQPLTISETTTETFLGEGIGKADTVVGFEYTGTAEKLEIVFKDDSNNGKTYIATIVLVDTKGVKLNVAYQTIGKDDEWNHLEVSGDSEKGYEFKWVSTIPDQSLNLPYGAILSEITLKVKNDGTIRTLEDILLEMMNIDVDLSNSSEKFNFNYKDNIYGWFIDKKYLTKYNFSSELKDDITLYAGYGIKITFNGGGAQVSPSEYYIHPGETLSKYFLDIDEESTGENDNRIQPLKQKTIPGYTTPKNWLDGDDKEFDFGTEIYQPITLYLKWEPEQFTIKLKFVNEDGTPASGVSIGNNTTDSNGCIDFTKYYGGSVTLNVGDSYRFVKESTNKGIFSGFGTAELTFKMPIIDSNSTGAYATIVIQEGITMTIKPMMGEGHNIEKFEKYTISVTKGTEEQTVTYVNGIATVFASKGTTYHINIKPEATLSYEWGWTFYDITNATSKFSPRGTSGTDVTVSGDASADMIIEYAVYRAVHLNFGVTVDHVEAKWYYAEDIVKEETFNTSGKLVYEGDILIPVPKSGCTGPPGVSNNVENLNNGTYRVLGNDDVYFGLMATKKVTIEITLRGIPQSITEHTSTLNLRLGGEEYTLQITIDYETSTQKLDVGLNHDSEFGTEGHSACYAELKGFGGARGTYNKDTNTVTFELTWIVYTVYYKIGTTWEEVELNLLEDQTVRRDGTAYVTVYNGSDQFYSAVWLKVADENSETCMGFVWKLSADLFNDDHNLYLIPLQEFTGSGQKTMRIVAKSTDLANGVDVSEEFRQDNTLDISVTSPGGTQVTYSTADGKLKVTDPGTGQFTVIMGGYLVTIVSIGTVQASR